jgi:hypothetical protein
MDVTPWRNEEHVSSDPSARAYGRRADALAKEDMRPAFVVCRLLRRSKLGEVSPNI